MHLSADTCCSTTLGREYVFYSSSPSGGTRDPAVQRKQSAGDSDSPPGMARCLGPALLLLLLLGSASPAGGNRCVAAAEACTADTRCQRLRTAYVARCLDRAAPGGCPRARCRRALRRFFARGPPALTLALLFCPCAGSACAERRRQTFMPTCAFSRPGATPPSCQASLDACEHSRVCKPRLLAFQAACAPTPSAPDGCLQDQAPSCRRAYAGLVGTAVTPNFVDNASAHVAPWCDCAASGNRREECEAFRGLFTRNRCLDGAIQGFDSGWLPTLQDRLGPRQDSEHSLLQMDPWRGTLCSPHSLSWPCGTCFDEDSRQQTTQLPVPLLPGVLLKRDQHTSQPAPVFSPCYPVSLSL
ncbi:GDNF family receptor alpha-4 isoform X2 [Choloepus didactylus]|uniref:GDNF family receptor alpha-4 isoform X2 n=1 Tax=Choloepus didactylus TaxID=27675 RepID=UPI00189F341D|nr:GDNF family receptor alpha-4 isoform X2 [Choloepus didactylus]